MDAALGATARWRSRPSDALSVRIRHATLAALVVSLLFVAITVVARRLAGALTEPLPGLLLVGMGAAAVIIAGAAFLIGRPGREMDGVASWVVTGHWLVMLSLPALAMALSLPGSSPAGLVSMWLTILVAEVGLLHLQRIGTINRIRATQVKSSAPIPHVPISDAASDGVSSPEDWQNEAATQRLIYHRTAEGRTAVEGWLRIELLAGQRTAAAHVAFCPAFARTPTIDAEPLDGPACAVRSTLVLPWGVRWEVKLDTAAVEPGFVILGFAAVDDGG